MVKIITFVEKNDMTDLNKIYLYRMTHIENVPHILEHVITHISSVHANKDYKSIGDSSLIGTRNAFILPNGYKLGSYIPFYFGVRMPMLYVIQNGYNGVQVTNAEDITYCISSVQKILDHGLPFLFTNGHAVDSLSNFFEQKDLFNIDGIIDMEAIFTSYWRIDNDLDLKRRKEAEFLVETDIPNTAIVGWAVYNQKARERLLVFGVSQSKTVIKPEYYF